MGLEVDPRNQRLKRQPAVRLKHLTPTIRITHLTSTVHPTHLTPQSTPQQRDVNCEGDTRWLL